MKRILLLFLLIIVAGKSYGQDDPISIDRANKKLDTEKTLLTQHAAKLLYKLKTDTSGGGNASYHIYKKIGIDGTVTGNNTIFTTDSGSFYFIPTRVIIVITDTVQSGLSPTPPSITIGWTITPGPQPDYTDLYAGLSTPFIVTPLFSVVTFSNIANPNQNNFKDFNAVVPNNTAFILVNTAGIDLLTFTYDVFVEGYYSDLH